MINTEILPRETGGAKA